MRLIDADELKSLYSKEEVAIRSRLFSIIDRTPETEEGKYKKLYNQMVQERDLYRDIATDMVFIEFVKDWFNEYIALNIINNEDECYQMVEKFVEVCNDR